MTRVLVVAAIAACSSRPPRPADPEPAPPDAGAAAPAVDDAGRPVMSEADCHRFIDHTVALVMAEQRATKPEAEAPTDADADQARAALVAEGWLERCVGADPADFACVFAATTVDAYRACLEPKT